MSEILEDLDLPLTFGIHSKVVETEVIQLAHSFESTSSTLIQSLLSCVYFILDAFQTVSNQHPKTSMDLQSIEIGVIGHGLIMQLFLNHFYKLLHLSPPSLVPKAIYCCSRTGEPANFPSNALNRTPVTSSNFIFTHDLHRTLQTHLILFACPYENILQLSYLYGPYLASHSIVLCITCALLPITLQRCFPQLPTSTLQRYPSSSSSSSTICEPFWINGVGVIAALVRRFLGFDPKLWSINEVDALTRKLLDSLCLKIELSLAVILNELEKNPKIYMDDIELHHSIHEALLNKGKTLFSRLTQ